MASERLISNHHLKIFKDSVPHEDSLERVGWLYRDCTVEPTASKVLLERHCRTDVLNHDELHSSTVHRRLRAPST